MSLNRLQVLLIEPDPNVRARVRQLCAEVTDFDSFHPCRSFDQAHERLTSDEKPINIVLVSTAFSSKEIESGLSSLRQTRYGKGLTFIAFNNVVDSPEVQNKIAEIDFHGRLQAPISIIEIAEIVGLAAKNQENIEQEKIEASVTKAIYSVINQLRIVPHLEGLGHNIAVPHKEKLRHLSQTLKAIPQSEQDTYYKCLLDCFSDLPDSLQITDKPNYRGVSARIRRRLESKIVSELKKF